MKEITLPSKYKTQGLRFAVIGGGKNACTFISLLSNKYPVPCILTHPYNEHERDKSIYNNERCRDAYKNIFEVAKKLNLPLHEVSNVNDDSVFPWLHEQNVNIAISFSCRSIIKKKFLDFFDGMVFNFHSTPLPDYRGGGALSWMIMNGEKKGGGVIHFIDEGIDTGDIVCERHFDIPNDCLPIDLVRLNQENFSYLGNEFLALLGKGGLSVKSQNKLTGTYFPRLKTEENGYINWEWQGEEIYNFIRAFSFPYPGASTFINGIKRINIGEVFLCKKRRYHTFCAGLIVEVSSKGANVIVKDGILTIHSLRNPENGSEISVKTLKAGDRLINPYDLLFKAKSDRIRV